MCMKKIILIIFIFLFLTGCSKKESITPIITSDFNIKDNNSSNQDTNLNDNSINNSKENFINDTSNSNMNYSSKDTAIINQLETIDREVDNLLNKEKNDDVKNKAKGIFIMLVDFVFYDGEINGVTFDSLTEAGKAKALKLINAIDEKIEKNFPNYKENISEKTSSAFLKASELIKKGASNIKEFAKEKLGEKYYQDIIDSKDEFLLYTKSALSIVGEFSSSLFNSLKDKLSNWYENFKDKS